MRRQAGGVQHKLWWPWDDFITFLGESISKGSAFSEIKVYVCVGVFVGVKTI